jgi:hypothetical protein
MRRLGVVLFGKSLQSGPAVAASPLLYWSALVDVLFSFVLFLHFLSQIEKNHFKSKKLEPVMQSLTEGIKFVFNNKTILGAITLDMVFCSFGGAIVATNFAQDILKVGTRRIWFLRAAPAVGALTMIITAYSLE